jgi:hypothetical protein
MLERIDDMSLVEPPLQLDTVAEIMRGVEARFGYRLNIWQPWVNRKQTTLVNKELTLMRAHVTRRWAP